jgi:hypothetical protein
MLISIHKNHTIKRPDGVNGKGVPYSPFIVFRMGSGVPLRIYGGDAGDAGLKALLAQISELVADGITDIMPIRGIEPTDNGEFKGFFPTFRFRPATQAEIESWSVREQEMIGLAWEALAKAKAAEAGTAKSTKAPLAAESKSEVVIAEVVKTSDFPF